MGGSKSLIETTGVEYLTGESVQGYEMHIGKTTGVDTAQPWLTLEGARPDGAISKDGRVMAAYMHGVFASNAFRHAFLNRIKDGRSAETDYNARVDDALNGLADHLEKHMDLDALLAMAR